MATAGQAPFDGYEAYYSTLESTLFKLRTAVQLEPYAMPGSETLGFVWAGEAAGRKHRVEIRPGVLSVDGRRIRFQAARAFPGEVANSEDLGRGTAAYFAAGWACVENTPPSASGTAVRHKSIYLIKLRPAGVRAWKLPGLFGSCTGIRQHDGQIRFDKVEYRYNDGQDVPAGVGFKEYAIQANNAFAPTGALRVANFVELANVYKFSVHER